MVISTVDADADLDNVARELKDLKVLVGRYETRATELQSELKLANDEYFDLLNVCSSRPSTTRVELQSRIEMYEKEMNNALRTNKEQELIIAKLTKKAERYKKELDLALKSLATFKNHPMPNEKSRHTKTEHKYTQTNRTLKGLKNVDSVFSLVESGDRRQLSQSEEFTHELLDMTFELHEQLSKCHARRSSEHNELNKFAEQLNKKYRQSIVKLRERQKKDLLALSTAIQRSADCQLQAFRTEQQELKSRLTKAEAAYEQSKITIEDLQRQVEYLQKQLHTMYENKEQKLPI